MEVKKINEDTLVVYFPSLVILSNILLIKENMI